MLMAMVRVVVMSRCLTASRLGVGQKAARPPDCAATLELCVESWVWPDGCLEIAKARKVRLTKCVDNFFISKL